jgi:hypothetical protein
MTEIFHLLCLFVVYVHILVCEEIIILDIVFLRELRILDEILVTDSKMFQYFGSHVLIMELFIHKSISILKIHSSCFVTIVVSAFKFMYSRFFRSCSNISTL